MNPARTDMKCGAMVAVVATVALSLLPVSAAYNAAGGYVTLLADNTKITVNDLWLEDGCRFQTAGANFDVTVKGRITVLAGSDSPLQFSLGGNNQ